MHDLERLNIIRIIQFAPFDAFILQKSNLYRIYGHNPPTPRKIEAVKELKKGKDFHSIARKMNVTLATGRSMPLTPSPRMRPSMKPYLHVTLRLIAINFKV